MDDGHIPDWAINRRRAHELLATLNLPQTLQGTQALYAQVIRAAPF